jgi:hypothetical protein
MALHIPYNDKSLVYEIADYYLKERLIAYVIITDNGISKELDLDNTINTSQYYYLKGLSKSLLFSTINDRLRARYASNTPLMYSEPIILMDSLQTAELVSTLIKA